MDLKRSFLEPKSEFTPFPFWFLNDELDHKEIKRQIRDFKSKGVDGFVLHPRIGLPEHVEYLSDVYMSYLETAIIEAQRLDMKVILYDEGMYPSGSANGKVVRQNPDFASKGLIMISMDYVEGECYEDIIQDCQKNICTIAIKKIYGEYDLTSMTRIEIKDNYILNQLDDGFEWAILFFVQVYTKGTIRGIHIDEDDGKDKAPASADLLNKEAVHSFINFTHDLYYKRFGKYFSNTIIAFFTDEPNIVGRNVDAKIIPWTDGFLEDYCKKLDIFTLPFLFWEKEGISDKVKDTFNELVNYRLGKTFYEPIAKWCEEHKIELMGHPEKSDETYPLKFFQVPGQDLVWRWVAPENNLGLTGVHSTMAKCSSDMARHLGKKRNSNECFGCCSKDGDSWHFSLDDMKWYMDWLFVRGVNLLLPHAFYYSVDSEIQYNERPPDVGPNNNWWEFYPIISKYMKRMSWLMTDSVNQTKIAVLHTGYKLPWKLVKPLYETQIEFNYLADFIFSDKDSQIKNGALHVLNQCYKILLVEELKVISEEIAPKIKKFVQSGGKVYTRDDGPNPFKEFITYVSEENLVKEIDKLSLLDYHLLESNPDIRISHLRKENKEFILITNEGEVYIENRLVLHQNYQDFICEIWKPWTGEIYDQLIFNEDGLACIPFSLERRECVILMLEKTNEIALERQKEVEKRKHLMMRSKRKIVWKSLIHEQEWDLKSGERYIGKVRQLEPWSNWTYIDNAISEVSYETQFHIEDFNKDIFYELEFEDVRELISVSINNIFIGDKLWPPYAFDITKEIVEGLNHLSCKVINSIANKYEKKVVDSGIVGKIKLIGYEYE